MDRRKFVTASLAGGGSLLAWPFRQIGSAQEPSADAASPLQMPNPSGFEQDYYEFSPDGRECIIKRPDTPMPWINLLTNDVFQAWVTHRGNIECFMLDRGVNSVINPEEKSGFVYVRDRESGKYSVINRPKAGETWQSRQGLGHTTIGSESNGLNSSVTYFVPRNDNVLVWLITVRNEGSRHRKVDVFSTVEWSLGDENKVMVFKGHGGGGDAYSGGSQFNLYKKVTFEDGVLYGTQPMWRTVTSQEPWPFIGFMGSSATPTGYDCLAESFLGHGRTVDNPIAIERGACSNIPFWSSNEYPWGVLQHSLDIPARGEERVAIVVGMARNRSEAAGIMERYSTTEMAARELKKVHVFWNDFIDNNISVETPEHEIDRVINVWSKYHWRTAMWKNLNTGLRGLGLWTYGLSWDGSIGPNTVAVQPHDLEITRESIINYFQNQYRVTDLGKMTESQPLMLYKDLGRPWPPPKTRGPFPVPHRHEVMELKAIPWYFQETGDLSLLTERVPFIDGGVGTVFEHLKVGIEYSLRGLSARSLPRLVVGLGDYDDEMTMVSHKGTAESVMFGMELCYLLRECAELAEAGGKHAEAAAWRKSYEDIKTAINTYAWDGDWYVYAFSDREKELIPVGSKSNHEGKIRLNAQSWAVLSGVAEGDRLKKCMDSIEKYLVTDIGPVLFSPPYSKLDRDVGTESQYAPGWRNGCNYFRPAGWAIMAACVANLPDLAFKMYWNSCLSRVSKDVERFQFEPYIYPENLVGPPNRLMGRGQWQWCLGEGTNWMWRSYVYYILGIRPVLNGLLVDPKIPQGWKEFKLRRPFRGATYDITVRNPQNVSMGVNSMRVDGKTIQGNLIPTAGDAKTHSVEVVIGA